MVEDAREIAESDHAAEFSLIVPATPVRRALGWEETETFAAARRRAVHARSSFVSAGLRVICAEVGDASPVLAVLDHLLEHEHEVIVVSTGVVGISRRFGLDLPARIARRFPHLPVLSFEREPGRKRVTAPLPISLANQVVTE